MDLNSGLTLKNDSKPFITPGLLKSTMNQPNEVKWILSWLLTTGTALHYKAGQEGKKDHLGEMYKLHI